MMKLTYVQFFLAFVSKKYIHFPTLSTSIWLLLQITEKCLSTIFELEHLEALVLEHCHRLDDEGLVSFNKSCQSLKVRV